MKRLLLGFCIAVFLVIPMGSKVFAQGLSESGGEMVEVEIFNQCASETFNKIFVSEKYRTRFESYLLDDSRWHKKGFNEFNKFRECVLAKGAVTGGGVPDSEVQAAVDAATAGMIPESEVQAAVDAATAGMIPDSEVQAAVDAATAGMIPESEVQAAVDLAMTQLPSGMTDPVLFRRWFDAATVCIAESAIHYGAVMQGFPAEWRPCLIRNTRGR